MKRRTTTPTRARELRTTADLVPDPRNANRGTDRGRQLLNTSLRDLGSGRSILVDRAGRVIAGNKTVEQAKALGLELLVVPSDGRRLIAVQRTDLDLERDQTAQALAIADNRIAELDLEWDVDVLRQLEADGLQLDTYFSKEEFAGLADGVVDPGKTDENAVVAPGPTDIVRGDLFQLGRHRLLCGDATDPQDRERLWEAARPLLTVTDPPWGVEYSAAWRHAVNPAQRTAVGEVMNDSRADWQAAFEGFPGDVAYVFAAGTKLGTVFTGVTAADFQVRALIAWVKQSPVLGRRALQPSI